MRVALDTNVLAYAEGVNGASMKNVALELVDRLPQASVVLPVQTLGELFQVLVRKAGRSPEDARSAILSWRDAFALLETSAGGRSGGHRSGGQSPTRYMGCRYSVCCRGGELQLLLSEDMQDGFIWQGVTIVNPFARSRHPPLKALLNQKP